MYKIFRCFVFGRLGGKYPICGVMSEALLNVGFFIYVIFSAVYTLPEITRACKIR